MPYVGRSLNTGEFKVITLSESFDGSRVDFTMSESVGNVNQLIVILSGVIQHWTDAFTVSGTTLTFSSAPANGETIKILKLGDTNDIGVPSDSSVTDAKIVDMAATKLTGNIADARVPASAVTQHVTGYDDSNIRADISALALREATNETSAAFNLPNSFVDTFTDDTNLGTQTTVDRTNGYIASIYTAVTAFTNDSNTVFLLHMDDTGLTDSSSNSITTTLNGGMARSSTHSKFGSYSAYFDGSDDYISLPDLDANDDSVTTPTTGNFTIEGWFKQTALHGADRYFSFGNNGTPSSGGAPGFTGGYSGNTDWNNYHSAGTNNTFSGGFPANSSNWHHIVAMRSGSTIYMFYDGVRKGTHSSSANMQHSDGTAFIGVRSETSTEFFEGYIDEFRYSNIARYSTSGSDGDTIFTPNEGTATSATGTLIQSANTVGSAKTEVSGTMIYKDNAGTATLGTDLKIYFTCNGGSNWTEAASYNAITPVYATGIKQVRLGKTTCTSGTDIRYKAVWANQASGSKETQLHGISINY